MFIFPTTSHASF